MIQAKGIRKSFGQVQVLEGVDISIQKGEVVSIVGSSGAGKTTLLQVLSSLVVPDQGSIHYDGIDISNFNSNKLAEFRNQNIGFIFQFHHLLPEFDALENICIPAFINGTPKAEAEKKALQLIDRLGLSHRKSHKPSQLSGGEQQRVATARALINNPKVIFADEPSGNLDSQNADELHQLFFDLRSEFEQTFVIVTHDNQLSKLCDKAFVMNDGNIVSSTKH